MAQDVLHWTDEQFWQATPKLFFDMQATVMELRGLKGSTEKQAPETKHVEYYDDLPAGFW